MTLDEATRSRQKCEKALDEVGASTALRKFCLEIVKYERDTSRATLRMHEKLRQLKSDQLEDLGELRLFIENIANDFVEWNRTVDSLVTSGKSLPPLQAPGLQGRRLNAPTSFQTEQLRVKEGDLLTVTDASKVNLIKVKTKDGKEDFVSILAFVLQSSDETIDELVKRLVVQLLGSWTDCISQSGKVLLRSAVNAFQSLNVSEKEFAGIEKNGSSIISRLKKFGEILKHLETDLVEKKSGKIKIQNQEIISNLLKTFSSYQKFFECWNDFRLRLKKRKPEAICVSENLEDLKKHVSENRRIKCFTTTFEVESTEIQEETVHLPMGDYDDDTSSYGGGGFWKQLIETEQLTSTSQEEKKRYIIKAIKDPRTGQNISLKDAVQAGIMDMRHGIYTNPDTEESIPIAVALSDGNIQVDYVTKTRSMPKTEALGLITVRDRVESRNYTISAVIDAITAERVDLKEAKSRGLVDEGLGHFTMNSTGEQIEMQEAIDSGWVLVDYDLESPSLEPEFQTRTYAVRAVVDQRLKRRVPFLEAVQRKLIDRESGNYYNNSTGETIHALEAIRRGFLKAKLIDDPSKLDIDPTNKMVVQSINKMKCLVTGLSALSAMKESANRLSTSSSGSL